MNVAQMPRPKVEGRGAVVYRCADCRAPIDGPPVFMPPLPLTSQTKTYHQEHLPNGR